MSSPISLCNRHEDLLRGRLTKRYETHNKRTTRAIARTLTTHRVHAPLRLKRTPLVLRSTIKFSAVPNRPWSIIFISFFFLFMLFFGPRVPRPTLKSSRCCNSLTAIILSLTRRGRVSKWSSLNNPVDDFCRVALLSLIRIIFIFLFVSRRVRNLSGPAFPDNHVRVRNNNNKKKSWNQFPSIEAIKPSSTAVIGDWVAGVIMTSVTTHLSKSTTFAFRASITISK